MAPKFVSQLAVGNVRGFRGRSFDFQPGFNLLVGENGAGKSTLLKALAATLAVPGLRPAPPGLTNDDITLGEHRLQVRATIQAENVRDSRQFSYTRHIGSGLRRTRRNESFPVLWYGPNEARARSFPIARKGRSTTSDQSSGVETAEEWLYSETRTNDRSPRDSQHFGKSEAINEFLARALGSFSQTFSGFDWVFEPSACKIQYRTEGTVVTEIQDGVTPRVEKVILQYVQSNWRSHLLGIDSRSVRISSKGLLLIGGEEIQVTPPFSEILGNIKGFRGSLLAGKDWGAELRLTPRVRVTTASGSRFLLNQLSDGEQRLFSIFVDIARQLSLRPAFEDFHASQALILVDEIDVHLHPKWQRRIVPVLEDLFPSCQFIATTHSPFVVQATREEKVQHLDRALLGHFTDRGIEEIAVKVMDVIDHEVSPRYLEMLDAAKDYFRAVEEARLSEPQGDAWHRLSPLKERLDSLSRKYASNPAYQAYLELMTELRLGGGSHP